MRSSSSLAHPSALPLRAEDCVVGNRGSVISGSGSVDALTGVAGVVDGLARLADLEGRHDLEHIDDDLARCRRREPR
jgi:hypothetical protein